MLEPEYNARLAEFDFLKDSYHKFPIVNHAVHAYAMGALKTREEALLQMVSVLCQQLDTTLSAGKGGAPSSSSGLHFSCFV